MVILPLSNDKDLVSQKIGRRETGATPGGKSYSREEELAHALGVTYQVISHRLRRLGRIQKAG